MSIFSKKINIKHQETLFVLLPEGLGDILYWMPVLRALSIHASALNFLFPEEFTSLQRVLSPQALGASSVRFVGSSMRPDFDKCIVLNDEDEVIQKYKQLIMQCKHRVGMDRAFYKGLFNYRVKQSRFLSDIHQYSRNQKLLGIFDVHTSNSIEDLDLSFLGMNEKQTLVKYVVLHPFSRGNGREWPISHYSNLALEFLSLGYQVIFTGSKFESNKISESFAYVLREEGVSNFSGELEIKEFIGCLSLSSLVVASSTGPIHLAAMLGTRALGLYVPKKGLGPSRWGPIGKNAYALSKSKCNQRKCCNIDCRCMANLSVSDVLKVSACLLKDDFSMSSFRNSNSSLNIWSYASS